MNVKNAVAFANAQNERLISLSKKPIDDLLFEFDSSHDGHKEENIEIMQEVHGVNIIVHKKPDSIPIKLIKAFIDPFTIVLFILAAISFVTDFIIQTAGEKDLTAVIIVLSMVAISGTLKFVQEYRSGKEAEALNDLVQVTAAVQRIETGIQEIPLDEVVAGDIVHLAAGDMVPADLRILTAKDLFVGQSALTGESEPIEKTPHIDLNKTSPLDCSNLAFMGSTVVSGTATAVVLSVGNNTVFGSISRVISEKRSVTSFEKGLKSVSWLLIQFMLFMIPFVLFLNGFTKGDWMQAFLFALSVAVGLTPEMLPMIVTTNLAKGAVQMAKKKTVIKNLNSIQNFGAMDILCTDKTGTLTMDKVVLEMYLNIHGESEDRVLRHALLNSYFQTGLKNLMDVAILNHAEESGFKQFASRYEKVDEIPFDFNRRRMSVVIKDAANKTQLITKGAVEEMLNVCSFAEYKGQIEPLTDVIKDEIMKTVDKLNSDGMRVIAVAQKTNPITEGLFSVDDESQMVLMGYLAFLDPPKETTKAAILALKEHGVGIKVLTGDNDAVTRYICRKVGLKVTNLLLGTDIDSMDDKKLALAVEDTTVFAKLSPQQKIRIVSILRQNGHTVGFMGDGINDAGAMKEADVGISVDTAVDIAKESADVILLQKDLMVLESGVIEGRKIFGNIIKYIKLTASSNFGNMLSILAASAFLPFLPMLPIQILVLNLIYDVSCISIPWDNMDVEFLKVPRKWDASSISKFMLWIGPASSIFDITTYILMYFIICPMALGGGYHSPGVDQEMFRALFNAGWFVESLWSQTLVIHMIRTPKIPFLQSRASWVVTTVTSIAILIGTVIPYLNPNHLTGLKMASLPWQFFPWLIGTIILYVLLITVLKKIYIRRYGELL